MSKKRKRGCAYIRVSHEREDGVSPDTQREKIDLQAQLLNVDVIKIYEKDIDCSGRTDRRPDFQQLMADVQKGLYDFVFVYKLDRFARSVLDFHKNMEILDKHGVAMVSVSQNFDTSSPTGRLLRNILIDFAQFESEMISERVKDNMTENARRGRWNGGQEAYGYTWNPEKRVLEMNENSRWVLFMFEEYARNCGANSIRNRLRLEKVNPKSGDIWSPGSIRYILRNPVYIGKIRWGSELVDGNHEPIVPLELFNRVQKILNENNDKSPREISSPHLLSGLIRCVKCGRKYTVAFNGKNRVLRYMCWTRKNVSSFECDGKIIDAISLEKAVIREVLSLSNDNIFFEMAKKSLLDALANSNPETSGDFNAQKENMEKRLKKLRVAMKELFDDFYLNKSIVRNQFELINSQYLEEEEVIAKRLKEITEMEDTREVQEENINILQQMVLQFQKNWEYLNNEEKRLALQQIITEIRPMDDYVEIDFFYDTRRLFPTATTSTTLTF